MNPSKNALGPIGTPSLPRNPMIFNPRSLFSGPAAT
jgi:hypothetical protein